MKLSLSILVLFAFTFLRSEASGSLETHPSIQKMTYPALDVLSVTTTNSNDGFLVRGQVRLNRNYDLPMYAHLRVVVTGQDGSVLERSAFFSVHERSRPFRGQSIASAYSANFGSIPTPKSIRVVYDESSD